MSLRSSLHAFGALLPVLRPERRGMLSSYFIGVISALALAALTVLQLGVLAMPSLSELSQHRGGGLSWSG